MNKALKLITTLPLLLTIVTIAPLSSIRIRYSDEDLRQTIESVITRNISSDYLARMWDLSLSCNVVITDYLLTSETIAEWCRPSDDHLSMNGATLKINPHAHPLGIGELVLHELGHGLTPCNGAECNDGWDMDCHGEEWQENVKMIGGVPRQASVFNLVPWRSLTGEDKGEFSIGNLVATKGPEGQVVVSMLTH